MAKDHNEQPTTSAEITIKELYERIVQLEVKVDGSAQSSITTASKLRRLVLAVVVVETLNFIANLIIIYGQFK